MIARIMHAGLCLAMLTQVTYSIGKEMINKAQWLDDIKAVLSTQISTVLETSVADTPIGLEWELVAGKQAHLNDIIKKVSPLLIQEYTRMELEFARNNPNEVETQMFLKPLAPLCKDGVAAVDWEKAENVLRDTLGAFFNNTDFAQYCAEQEASIFVVAREHNTGMLLGVIQFLIKPEFEYGTVKAAFFAVSDAYRNCGLEKLLMDSIFKLVPGVTRIFLHTRDTNTNALDMYTSWSFSRFGESDFWVNMEYNVEG